MHLFEFFKKIKSPNSTILENIFFANKAMDSYFKNIFLGENLKTKSYNYIIVSLIRFGIHQLTTRCSVSNGNQIALFILDEQNFLDDIDLGVNDKINVNCDLLLKDKTNISIKNFNIYYSDLNDYLKNTNPNIGLLVLNLKDQKSLEIVKLLWPKLNIFCDIIFFGKLEILQLFKKKFNVSKSNHIFSKIINLDKQKNKVSILLLKKHNHFYNQIIASELR